MLSTSSEFLRNEFREMNNSPSITANKWNHIVTQAAVCIRESLMEKMQLYLREKMQARSLEKQNDNGPLIYSLNIY